ncbi:MAG: alanine/glycine:cation symporter family protein [Bacteroidota bacterium]|nr:alanine/glycine:cation symporter family protein [Bacteroidota bacterium]
MNFKSLILPVVFLFFSGLVQAQSLSVNVSTDSKSKKINNAEAIAQITGGERPFTYHWSNQSTALTADTSKNLTEGKEYTLLVTDNAGDSVLTKFEVPAISADERINTFFIPIVDAFGTVLMFDIFDATGLYDPVIYDSEGKVLLYPNGEPKKIKIPFVVVWLVFGAIFFTIKMRFVNFRAFRHVIDLLKGKFDNPKAKGEVSHFQALATALSATVGLGNIAGVAIAITIGGPGATFWMILAGLLGMASKFSEVTLGVKYRNIESGGKVAGGPMYYLKKGLQKRNLGGLGKVLAFIFAVLVIGGSLGGGNMFQANQAFAQFSGQLVNVWPEIQGYGAYFGIAMSILVGIVIIGGIKSIAKVTEKIVPFMAILYVFTALIIIGMNIQNTGEAFGLIFNGAFSSEALRGGIIGVMIVGFQRAAFSNEAGVGSAAVAHSAVKTDEPVSEGLVAMLEPMIDTVLICTMTALVIIYSGYWHPDAAAGFAGAELTSKAFGTVFEWFPWFLTVAIFLFAFSTMISWSYYGLNGFKYIFKPVFGNRKVFKDMSLSALIYYFIFLSAIIVGASASLGAVVDFSDMMILSMALPNILGVLIMSGEVKQDMISYFKRLKDGAISKTKD